MTIEGEVASVKAAKERGEKVPEAFTIHDFRRLAITDLQASGLSEKETSLLVGATPGVIRKHYERIDRMVVARKAHDLRDTTVSPIFARLARRRFGRH